MTSRDHFGFIPEWIPEAPNGTRETPGDHFGFSQGKVPDGLDGTRETPRDPQETILDSPREGVPGGPDGTRDTPRNHFGFATGGSAAEAPRSPRGSHGELNGNVRVLKL